MECEHRAETLYETTKNQLLYSEGVICILKEIIIQRKNFDIQIYDKQSSLPESILEWQKIKKQDKGYIDRLKKQGETIQYFKVMKDKPIGDRKTRGYYYKLYNHKKFAYEQRLSVVNSILNNRKHSCGVPVGNHVADMQTKSNTSKKGNEALFDKESILLSSLGEYLIRATEDANINYGEDIVRIQNTEVATFGEYIRSKSSGNYIKKGESKHIWNKNIATENDLKRFERRFPAETRRWKNSKTYRMNMIFSYDNSREDDLHYERDGLINSDEPYIAEWCVVDTENEFKFRNNTYKISKDVAQYNIRSKKPRHDDYKNDYQMDQILVCEQGGNLHFFDEDIFQISDENIIIKQ